MPCNDNVTTVRGDQDLLTLVEPSGCRRAGAACMCGDVARVVYEFYGEFYVTTFTRPWCTSQDDGLCTAEATVPVTLVGGVGIKDVRHVRLDGHFFFCIIASAILTPRGGSTRAGGGGDELRIQQRLVANVRPVRRVACTVRSECGSASCRLHSKI